MLSISHKAKQYLLAALKVFIIGSTFWYIYHKINTEVNENLNEFLETVFSKNTDHWSTLLFFIGLAVLNWLLESLKWKETVSALQSISFRNSIKQSLISLSVSLITPNRIGEYGAKAYFFQKPFRKQVLLLNFFHNNAQLLITLIFGLLGLSVIIPKFDIEISFLNVLLLGIVLLGFCLLGYLLKERQLLLKGLTLKKVFQYFKKIPKHLKAKIILLSLLRYIIFSGLFFLLLCFFGASLTYLEAMPLIFSMYLLVSVIPSVFIFDGVVRGGVAVWLFSLAEVGELIVLSTVLIMWVLNFVFPAIVGSILFLKQKPKSL
ncbi:lysylphosphatidylglycerol synthase domain-containing protein [Jejudonia soesokkakensis]|uniref:Lysylphosphatidylglycerol synthase domain-containing protein n=1 Tax=Jejudonia soesokkakensis TaxID=1323432 RepID=A0ABW2MSJ0_9FLAO